MQNKGLHIEAIQAFSDNYIWAISHSESDFVTLVDPGDSDVCIKYLTKNNKKLSAILVTHYHYDHINGINSLVEYANIHQLDINIYGPANEKIPHITHSLQESDTVELSDISLSLNVLDIPGHTLGHIAFHNSNVLFCGDTLFSGGCGRIFEGTPKQMKSSLAKLTRLPEHTAVYCTHEYTQANLSFAVKVEPNNRDLAQYLDNVNKLREENKITLPSSIKLEKEVNPFLRCFSPTIKESVHQYSQQQLFNELDVFTELRAWKNNA